VVQVGYLPSPPTQPIATKIGMGCPVADVINHAKFQHDRFRSFRAPDGRKSLSPIDLRHHLYNSYALPCYTVILVIMIFVFSDEAVDDPFNLDANDSDSSLSEVEQLDKTIQSDQCFIRCVDLLHFVMFLFVSE